MQKLIPKLLFILLISCGDADESNASSEEFATTDSSEAVDSLVLDTLQIAVDPNRPKTDLDQLLSKATENYELPLKVDSSFISQISLDGQAPENYNLTGNEASYLSYLWVKGVTTGNNEYQIKKFMELDSIKQAGDAAYEEYQNNLDLGMARYCAANVLGKAEVSDQSFLLLWFSDYATYEACPYGSGTYVFATLFSDQKPLHSLMVGEMSGGGDPPVWGDTYVTSEITVTSISLYKIDRFGEEDYETGEEIIEETESTCRVEIRPTEMVVVEPANAE